MKNVSRRKFPTGISQRTDAIDQNLEYTSGEEQFRGIHVMLDH